MTRAFLIALTLAAAGCTDWPDVPGPQSTGAAAGWPSLGPLDTDGAAPAAPADDPGPALAARAAALRARALLLRTPVEDQAAFERLRARLGA